MLLDLGPTKFTNKINKVLCTTFEEYSRVKPRERQIIS